MTSHEFITSYALPIAVSIAVLWLAYRLLFVNSNRFKFNRSFLLVALLFSLALPLVGLLMGLNAPQIVEFRHSLFPGYTLNEIVITPEGQSVTPVAEVMAAETSSWQISLWQVLGIIYLVGVAVMAVLFLVKLVRLVVLIIRSPKQKMDGYTAVYTHKEQGSFSFFRYAFFPDEKVSPDIVRHEMSHIAHGHSWDILFVEIIMILQWFNPFIYLYKRELQSLHEYSADHDVVTSGVDKKNYMMLILQQCTAVDFSSMSNNFSLILTKKRIKMITRNEKARSLWWRLLATIPVLVLLLFVNARVSAQQVKPAGPQAPEIKTAEVTDVNAPKVSNDSIYNIVEVMPEFPGGTEKFMEYLSGNIKYPEEAKEKNISGRVFLSFVIEKDGSVTNVQVMKSIGGGCDEEAVRVVKAMPKWKPGMQKGKPVRVNYILPVTFKLNEKESSQPVVGDVKPDEDGVWPIAETRPEYPGGMDGLREYLQANLTMPEKYQKMTTKAEYRVFVQFVVAEDGSITKVEVLKPEPSRKELNDEAVRAIKGMPKWKPGTVDGKPVKVKYIVPVTFKVGK